MGLIILMLLLPFLLALIPFGIALAIFAFLIERTFVFLKPIFEPLVMPYVDSIVSAASQNPIVSRISDNPFVSQLSDCAHTIFTEPTKLPEQMLGKVMNLSQPLTIPLLPKTMFLPSSFVVNVSFGLHPHSSIHAVPSNWAIREVLLLYHT